MRVLALDIGEVRIGIAASDPLGIIAGGYESYTRDKRDKEKDYRYIADYIKQTGAGRVVLGMPYHMNGDVSAGVLRSQNFAAELKKYTDAEIDYMDERLTSVQAERILVDANVSRDKRKQVIDKMAATIILQAYLDKMSNQKRKGETTMSDKIDNNMDEFEDSEVVVFQDDEGNEIEFIELRVFEFEGKEYAALTPADVEDDEDEEEGDPLYFCEVTEAEDGEENLEMIDDEQLIDKLFDVFLALENAEGGCACGKESCDCDGCEEED